MHILPSEFLRRKLFSGRRELCSPLYFCKGQHSQHRMIESMATTTTVKLISKDGCEFCIPLSCCRLSEVITSSELECQEESSQEDGVENQNNSCITLSLTTSRIHSTTLRKVVDFLTHYEKEEMIPFEPPFDSEDIKAIVKQTWYSDFITKDVDHSLLIDIISAANFLVSASLFVSWYLIHIKTDIITIFCITII